MASAVDADGDDPSTPDSDPASDSTPFRAVWNGLVTVALAPGILSHEYAHVLGCRAWSIDVHALPRLNPFGDDAYLDHEPVESFGPDLTIAIAPFLLNTLLGIAAFAIAPLAGHALATLGGYWLGVCFALTAFPSPSDTDGLIEAARSLPPRTRPLGYLTAYPIRAATRWPAATGPLAFAWIVALYEASGWIAA